MSGLKEMATWVLRFGKHKEDCEAFTYKTENRCNCGFKDARRKAERILTAKENERPKPEETFLPDKDLYEYVIDLDKWGRQVDSFEVGFVESMVSKGLSHLKTDKQRRVITKMMDRYGDPETGGGAA